MSIAVSRNSLASLEGVEFMEKLSTLNISYNKIIDMSELLRMRGLHQVVELDLRMNPVCKQESYRLFVIKYLPRLKRLDGKDISTAERARSERLFSNLDYTSSSSDAESILDRDRRRGRDEQHNRTPPKNQAHTSKPPVQSSMYTYMSDDSDDDDLDFARVTAKRRAAAAARNSVTNSESPESPTNSVTFARIPSTSTRASSSASTPVKSTKEAAARNMAGMSAIDRRRQLLSAPSSSSSGPASSHTQEHTNDHLNSLTPRQMSHAHTSRGGSNDMHDAYENGSHEDTATSASSLLHQRTVHAHTPKRLHTDAPTDSPHDHSTRTPSILGSDSHMKASSDHIQDGKTQQQKPQYHPAAAAAAAADNINSSNGQKRRPPDAYHDTNEHTPDNQGTPKQTSHNQGPSHTPNTRSSTPHMHTANKIEEARGGQTRHEHSNTPSSMRQAANMKWTRALEEALQDEYYDTLGSDNSRAESRTQRRDINNGHGDERYASKRATSTSSSLGGDEGYASKRASSSEQSQSRSDKVSEARTHDAGTPAGGKHISHKQSSQHLSSSDVKPTQTPVSTESKLLRGGGVHAPTSSRGHDDDHEDNDSGTDRQRHGHESVSSVHDGQTPARAAADTGPPLSIGSLHHKYSTEKPKGRSQYGADSGDSDLDGAIQPQHGRAGAESLKHTTPVNAKQTTPMSAKNKTPVNLQNIKAVNTRHTTTPVDVGGKNASRHVKMQYTDSDSEDAEDGHGARALKGNAKAPVTDRHMDRQSSQKKLVGAGRRVYEDQEDEDARRITPMRVVNTMKHTYRQDTDSPQERQNHAKGAQQQTHRDERNADEGQIKSKIQQQKTPQQRLQQTAQQTPQRGLRKGTLREDVSGIVYDALDVLGCARYLCMECIWVPVCVCVWYICM
jgi:hypothetical protein